MEGIRVPSMQVPPPGLAFFPRSIRGCLLHVCCAFYHTHNVVALREEGHPVFQSALFLVIQIVPLGGHILSLGGSLSERAGSILASENCMVAGYMSVKVKSVIYSRFYCVKSCSWGNALAPHEGGAVATCSLESSENLP